jgi:hypothetical protein
VPVKVITPDRDRLRDELTPLPSGQRPIPDRDRFV